MKKIYTIIFLFVLIFSITYCSEKKNNNNNKIIVTVSVPPQAFLAKKIGQDKIRTNIMIPKNVSPGAYEPTSKQMMELSNSDLYIKVGVVNFPFEKKYLYKIIKQNNKMNIIDMSKDIELIEMDKPNSFDAHIWLSPHVVKNTILNIYKTLAKIDPKNEDFYKKNYNDFVKEIDELDNSIRNNLKDLEYKSFMTYHPAFGYFAKEYGLEQIAIEKEGKEPSSSLLKEIIEKAKSNKIKFIFIQEGHSQKMAKVIAKEINAEVLEVNPLEEDWLSNMKNISLTIQKSLAK